MNGFIRPTLRPLPVILLLDTSGSMYGESIDSLNIAVKKMLESFKDQDSTMAEIYTAIITFGGRASIHSDFSPVSEVKWSNLDANGQTPLGGALELCRELIINLGSGKFNGKPYKPTIVLVSDGVPTDNYAGILEEFINSPRTGTCDRWALAIGEQADYAVLERFISGQEKRVLQASDASGIAKFFQLVTNSTQLRTKSSNPNQVQSVNVDDLILGRSESQSNIKTSPSTNHITNKVNNTDNYKGAAEDESPFSF